MARIHVAALAAVLLLAMSDSSFAVTKVLKKHSSVAESKNRSANSGSGLRSYGRDLNPYGRENPYANWPDPYAPGVNWPGHW